MDDFHDSAYDEKPAEEKYRRDGHHERRAYRDRAKDDQHNPSQVPSPTPPEFAGPCQLNCLFHRRPPFRFD
jgi:hypothetical protein